MSARRSLGLFYWASVVASSFLFLFPAAFHATPKGPGYKRIRNIPLHSDDGYDYLTVDSDARRVYIPRGTHIQVVDEGSGAVIADIPDLKGLHGVAIALEFN